ncbi:hypothetical protein TNIN_291 [Trichonephila inaurata madagascariensis]|uniref:Uncharacterized protein n=1 Tax=Trichonephila inaurata madagascariensis TaxID=2747483 RepID=A0A8X6YI86_9ARAC|nr:hypothetical protein TNIN_291 [Trichonephila inaurata madagascariensis]
MRVSNPKITAELSQSQTQDGQEWSSPGVSSKRFPRSRGAARETELIHGRSPLFVCRPVCRASLPSSLPDGSPEDEDMRSEGE